MPERSLILAGVDEAGYGPLLGPLCVGMSVFEVPHAAPEAPPPCLWKLLSRAVSKEAGRGGKTDAKGRIPVADSKQLKLASSVTTTHPLVHLERAVLAMARCAACGNEALVPGSDTSLLGALGASWPDEPWYGIEETPLPVAHDAAQLAITCNGLAHALRNAGVRVHALRCRVVGETEFNALANAGGKAATTAAALREFLTLLWEEHARPDGSGAGRLGIVCDRQGGRVCYGDFLGSALPGAAVTVLEESDLRSRYVIEGVGADGAPRRAGVSFLVEGERHHLPVALASMIAKYTRELAMMRFNRAWCGLARERANVEIKPTAGYSTDAGRWLRDADAFLTAEERRRLVRVL
ncbi:MAG TPA: hypothetical protein VD971_04245 [Phycisphaerales bacterium]|nr:hypothetical protein [Phycisphaerales bacterium]